ncbi:hypothetical protein CH275_20955 [Rhodococcus sp. 06-235-1A]|uniref:hypothetical protein n=1 Tax=Rhodococcus sp. 06-235-1A TaxID=2022508 RepID=UPI000B9C6903|nr:hypothetical protein [Rhodococcus sp. 06-235-1A]OZD01187.1 hypothetical protein CH275_20955 [Rhodococcus sp. 06-235-1A]
MTVILFARATSGYVIASDGRTCSPNLPKHIETDTAKKIRWYHIGEGGYVTASSGRAWIGGDPISKIEEEIVDQFGGSITSPAHFIAHITDKLKEYNRQQKCDCASRHLECVFPAELCYLCGQNFDCGNCDEIDPKYEWMEPGDGGCLCSPGDRLSVSTSPSKFPTGCRCKPTREAELSWLCVPFGPNAGEVVSATISNKFEPIAECQPVHQHFLLEGELLSGHRFGIPVVSTTKQRVDAANSEPLVDIAATADIVWGLLRTAYFEAADSATLRWLDEQDLQSYQLGIDTDRPDVTVSELATAIESYNEIRLLVGASSIGGAARIVTIDGNGDPTSVNTENNFGLPVTVCPIHPEAGGPCPPADQAYYW